MTNYWNNHIRILLVINYLSYVTKTDQKLGVPQNEIQSYFYTECI